MIIKRWKKISAAAMAMVILLLTLVSCGGGIKGIDAIPWQEYDALIESIKSELDASAREALLHRAEDTLMSTECIVPLYYYKDVYLMKSQLSGVYASPFGAKYFMYSQRGSENQLEISLGEALNSVDPALAQTTAELTAVVNMFSGLYAYDSEGNIIPELASDYRVSEDALTYTFTLKTGLRWSDGSAIGASDFIYSWRRVADSETGSPYRYLFDIIAKDETGKLMISADETDTVLTVTLVSPCDYLIDLCAYPAFYPVKSSYVEYANGYRDSYGNIIDADAWTKSPRFAVSGAYVLMSKTEGVSYGCMKNDNYVNSANVKTENIILMIGTDTEAAYDSYLRDELDYLGSIPASRHDELEMNPEFNVDDVNGIYYLCFNYNSNIFSGMRAEDAIKLRRAMSLQIDREFITSNVTGNGETVATGIVPEMISDGSGGLFRTNDKTYRYKFADSRGYFSSDCERSRAEAAELLKGIGFDSDGDGKIDPSYSFTLNYLTLNDPTAIIIAQSVQQDLADIGIMVKITAVSEHVFDYEQKIFNYDIVSCRYIAGYDDALAVLELWSTGANRNWAGLGKEIVVQNENAY